MTENYKQDAKSFEKGRGEGGGKNSFSPHPFSFCRRPSKNISTPPPALKEQNAESKIFFTFFVFVRAGLFNLKGKENFD